MLFTFTAFAVEEETNSFTLVYIFYNKPHIYFILIEILLMKFKSKTFN